MRVQDILRTSHSTQYRCYFRVSTTFSDIKMKNFGVRSLLHYMKEINATSSFTLLFLKICNYNITNQRNQTMKVILNVNKIQAIYRYANKMHK